LVNYTIAIETDTLLLSDNSYVNNMLMNGN